MHLTLVFFPFFLVATSEAVDEPGAFHIGVIVINKCFK